ncbi:MAG: sigma 54-interacting transcriptional regulator [Spirochaetales bacterium]|nr:sigma 54-interacting transcriptional regulator [Spirochaetales bacterium]
MLNLKHKNSVILLIIIAAIFLFSHLIVFIFPGIFEVWNSQINDLLFHLRYAAAEKEKVSPYVIHIVFNDSSYRELELTPWDRRVYGKLITIAKQAGIKLLAYDVFFRAKSTIENDRLLISATENSGMVYYPIILYPHGYSLETDKITEDIVTRYIWHPEIVQKGNPPTCEFSVIPFNELSLSAKGLGHVNIDPDRDGINRKFPLLYKYNDGYIPSLIFRLLCDYLTVTEGNIKVSFGQHIILENAKLPGNIIKDIKIPVDAKGRVIINYVAPWKDSFFEFPVTEILKAEDSQEHLLKLYDKVEGSVAIISDISARNKDIGPGIFDKAYPYGGLHVNIANMILTQNFIDEIDGIGTFLISLFMVACLWLLSVRFKSIRFLGLSLLLYMIFVCFNIFLFITFKTLPRTIAPTIGFILSIIGISIYHYTIEEKEKTAFNIKLEENEVVTAKLREQIIDYTTEINNLKSKEDKNNNIISKHIDELNKKRNIIAETIEDIEAKNIRELNKIDRKDLENSAHFSEIITHNKTMFSIFKKIEAISKSSKAILITGESGTGKELIAKAIHNSSNRTGKFVTVNVAGLDDTAFTDTLFGHKKGAFTGAVNERYGLVKKAEEGTLFLDEIGDLEKESQVKLLRLLQEGEYYTLGSDVLQKSNTRIVAATNADLVTKIKQEKFRKDLKFRFAHPISIPPLKERPEDIPLLLDYFLKKSAQFYGKKKPTPPKELEILLQKYHFPGNIRELENMVEEAVCRNKSKKLSLAYFLEYIQTHSGKTEITGYNGQEIEKNITYSGAFPTLADIEKHFILEALNKAHKNKTIAAQLLGITYFTLNRKLKKFGLDK